MPFTNARWEAYSPHTDGTLYVPATQANDISGTTGRSKVAAGDYALTLGNSITAVLAFPLPAILRTGEPHLECVTPYEQYNTGPTPYQIPGVQAGTTVPVLKGVQLTSVSLVYLLAGAAATENTVGVFAKEEINGAASVITTLLAQSSNGLATATSAERYVTNVVIPSPAFTVTPNTTITVEWDIETASGGTADIFGVIFNFNFNLD